MHPTLAADIDRQGGVFTRAQALACGYSAAEISGLLRTGAWRRRRRGVFATAETVDRALTEPRSAHLLDAAGVLASMRTAAYLSHRTAAIAWQLPLVGVQPTAVALTTERQHRREAA